MIVVLGICHAENAKLEGPHSTEGISEILVADAAYASYAIERVPAPIGREIVIRQWTTGAEAGWSGQVLSPRPQRYHRSRPSADGSSHGYPARRDEALSPADIPDHP